MDASTIKFLDPYPCTRPLEDSDEEMNCVMASQVLVAGVIFLLLPPRATAGRG